MIYLNSMRSQRRQKSDREESYDMAVRDFRWLNEEDALEAALKTREPIANEKDEQTHSWLMRPFNWGEEGPAKQIEGQQAVSSASSSSSLWNRPKE